MAASIVQVRVNSDFSGNGTTFATSASLTTVAAGDAIVVFFTHDYSNGAPTMTCADSAGNTYTAALDVIQSTGDTQKMATFVAVNCASGSGVTPTVTGTGPAMFGRGIVAVQVTGVVATALGANEHKGQNQTAPTTTADLTLTTNMTPTGAGNNLIVAHSFNAHGSGGNAPTAGTGFTDQGATWAIGGNNKARTESKIVVGTSGVSGTFTAVFNESHLTSGVVFAETSTGSAVAVSPTITVGATGGSLAAAAVAVSPTITVVASAGGTVLAAVAVSPTITVGTTGKGLAAAAVAVSPTIAVAVAAPSAASAVASSPTITVGATGGALAAGAVACSPAITVGCAGLQQGSIYYPATVASGSRYLLDKRGVPLRLQTDTFFTLHAHLSQGDIDTYLDTLVTLGFNGFRLMHAVHATSTFGDSLNEPNDFYNNPPWTTPNELDTPGAAYATNLNLLIDKANVRGLVVLLEALYCGFAAGDQGWEGDILGSAHNTNTICLNYGAHLGNTYTQPNIIWSFIGDHILTGATLTKFQNIVAGIQSVSRTRLAGGELRDPDTHITDQSGFTYGTDPATSDMQLDTFYGIGPTANGRTYETANDSWAASTTLPSYIYEIAYLNNNWNTFEARAEVRMLHHWAVTAGSWAGSNYGDDFRFFDLGTGKALDTLSTTSTLDKSYANAFYTSFAWYKMRPSGTATGYAGRTLIASTNTRDDNYISSSMTSDGQCLVAYIPHIRATTTVTFTVDCRSMNGSARARWWNPTTGVYTNVTDGTYDVLNTDAAHSFTTPGTNGSSTGDWALLLETLGTSADVAVSPAITVGATGRATAAAAVAVSPTITVGATGVGAALAALDISPAVTINLTGKATAAAAVTCSPVIVVDMESGGSSGGGSHEWRPQYGVGSQIYRPAFYPGYT